MNKIISQLLIVFSFSGILNAQFTCSNITIEGIYFNNFNTSHLSLVLSNKSPVPDNNGNVYTNFQLITDSGDSLLTSEKCNCYRLPKSQEDTFVYNIEIHENYRTIYDLPEQFCGQLISEFPDCSFPVCYSKKENTTLPPIREVNCNDYKIIAIYDLISNPPNNRSMLLGYTNPDSLGYGPSAYTTFEFFNAQNESLNINSGPHYILPQSISDTLIVHLSFHDSNIDNICGQLRTTGPTCVIDHCPGLINSQISVNTPEIEIYPNPVVSQLTLKCSSNFRNLEIYNSKGQKIKQSNSQSVDMSPYSNGVYYCKVSFKDNSISTIKFVKQ